MKLFIVATLTLLLSQNSFADCIRFNKKSDVCIGIGDKILTYVTHALSPDKISETTVSDMIDDGLRGALLVYKDDKGKNQYIDPKARVSGDEVLVTSGCLKDKRFCVDKKIYYMPSSGKDIAIEGVIRGVNYYKNPTLIVQLNNTKELVYKGSEFFFLPVGCFESFCVGDTIKFNNSDGIIVAVPPYRQFGYQVIVKNLKSGELKAYSYQDLAKYKIKATNATVTDDLKESLKLLKPTQKAYPVNESPRPNYKTKESAVNSETTRNAPK